MSISEYCTHHQNSANYYRLETVKIELVNTHKLYSFKVRH